jgi:acyl-ACP thioesterase
VGAEAFTELVEPPAEGRIFVHEMWPGFADCAPSGRIRLDALARWLQDIAYADVQDAGLADSAVWVVRRTRIRVSRFPRFAERYQLATFCSGMGRMWAERRTNVTAMESSRCEVEAVSLWVHLDPSTWRPSPFNEQEIATYGGSAGGRRVSARLRHPAPQSPQDGQRWWFRATERDIAGHINNAAYWQPLEEELLASGEPERMDVEIEYRAPAQPGEKVVLCDGLRRWIVDEGGEMHASLLLADAIP